jgi:nucleotide-binding universal stress UspA family protein
VQKILIPTDFSELGDFAYIVATHLTKATNAKIIALSVLTGPSGAVYTNSGDLVDDEGEDYSEWNRRLKENEEKMKSWISNKPDIVESKCIIGNVDKTILRVSEQHEVDLIVMGTHGLFMKSAWAPGSHTEFVTNHSSVPVLSLKCDRSDIDLNQIVFVSDFLEPEKINLGILKAIQKAYNSKLVLLKVITSKQSRTEEQIKEDMVSFANLNELENYTMHTYKDDTVEGGIGKFCAEKDIDLIVLGTHQTRGFSKLFRQSVSDDVVNHLYHPILTFPIH